jgi:hypothetical protein
VGSLAELLDRSRDVTRQAAAASSLSSLLLLCGLVGWWVAAPIVAQEPAPAAQQLAARAPAAEETASSAPVTATDAQAFLGHWLLTVQLGQSSQKFGLLLDDEGIDGNDLRGKLISGFGEMTAEKLALSDGALAFDLASDVGRFRVEIQVEGSDDCEASSATPMRTELTGEKSDAAAFERFLVPDDESRITRAEQMVPALRLAARGRAELRADHDGEARRRRALRRSPGDQAHH